MSKHLCHWTRKDMRRVADACEQLDVDIEHVIVLDLLSEPESSIFDDPVDDLLDAEGPEELEAVFGKPLGGHVYKAGAGPEGRGLLRDIGGFLVLGWFQPPDVECVCLDDADEICGYGLETHQMPCRAWSPYLHTAIGKCLAQAARTKRDILRVGREIALRRREA